MKGLIFDIRRFCVNDGLGIRTSVFFKGCPLNCRWCHNPESQSPEPETSHKKLALDGFKFAVNEITGRWMIVQDIVPEVEKDRIFYEESGGGITISGGEPFNQPEFLLELLESLKFNHLNIALDTSGFTEWKWLEKTLKYVDLYLYDLKIMDDSLHLEHTGVSNKLILDNLLKLAEQTNQIIIRLPVIPGINDNDGHFESLASFLQPLMLSVREVNLLPYHSLGKQKYSRLGKENFLKNTMDLPKEALYGRMAELERNGFKVKIGG
jgi:pyruvate formate lyase activating enzyme